MRRLLGDFLQRGDPGIELRPVEGHFSQLHQGIREVVEIPQPLRTGPGRGVHGRLVGLHGLGQAGRFAGDAPPAAKCAAECVTAGGAEHRPLGCLQSRGAQRIDGLLQVRGVPTATVSLRQVCSARPHRLDADISRRARGAGRVRERFNGLVQFLIRENIGRDMTTVITGHGPSPL
ncbi:hypothetical protein ACFS5L_05870 [Streptomyces phyllanthi]|uniref:Uncharacterized protein n=1 Tax=Streptomyces phyllanthi TaxID=1803180 RepID=A0A5N8VYW7_9ACTN|nr:hypothetical protein [Streptomyces phyllanthi]MPY39125.1 hypothetical protein [Streptomyces phyllanthi]